MRPRQRLAPAQQIGQGEGVNGPLAKLRLVALIMAVVLAGYGVGTVLDRLRLPGIQLDDTPSLRELRVGAEAPSEGEAQAPVTVVVFTDYQCGVCRIDHRGLQEVIASEPRARFVFKEWAILGSASREAARVALASAYQGRYPAVRDALMRAPVPLSSERIRQAAIAAGADWEQLEHDLARHSALIDGELGRASREAFGLGLGGTPAYLVGNRLILGRLPERQLRRLIDRAAGT